MEMVKSVKFLLCVDMEESGDGNYLIFSYWPYYYCFTKERCDEPTQYFHGAKIVKKDRIGEIVDAVVEDWIVCELSKNKDYVLGLTRCSPIHAIFPTNEAMESFKEIIKFEISKKFNRGFIENNVCNSVSFLFNLQIDVGRNNCKLVSRKIVEHNPIDDSDKVKAFERGIENDKENQSNIKFIIKTVPSLLKKEEGFSFDAFAFTYNRLCDSLKEDEVFDLPSVFLNFEEVNEFSC